MCYVEDVTLKNELMTTTRDANVVCGTPPVRCAVSPTLLFYPVIGVLQMAGDGKERSARYAVTLVLSAGALVSLLLGRSMLLQAGLAVILAWLLTGTRYQWLYILQHTLGRDIK